MRDLEYILIIITVVTLTLVLYNTIVLRRMNASKENYSLGEYYKLKNCRCSGTEYDDFQAQSDEEYYQQ